MGLSARQVLDLARQGRLPHIRYSPRIVRFDLDDVEAWIDSRAAGNVNRPERSRPGVCPPVAAARYTFIYFIQGDDPAGPVKIGQSATPLSRLGDLQVASPIPLQIRRAIWAHPELEIALHATFWDDRITGEWFKVLPTLRRIMAAEHDKRLHQRMPSWAVDFIQGDAK